MREMRVNATACGQHAGPGVPWGRLGLNALHPIKHFDLVLPGTPSLLRKTLHVIIITKVMVIVLNQHREKKSFTIPQDHT